MKTLIKAITAALVLSNPCNTLDIIPEHLLELNKTPIQEEMEKRGYNEPKADTIISLVNDYSALCKAGINRYGQVVVAKNGKALVKTPITDRVTLEEWDAIYENC